MVSTALHPCPYCAIEVAGGGIHASHPNAGRRDPIDVLMRDHEFLAGCLDRVEKASTLIEQEGFDLDAFDTIVDAVHHISREIRGHHHREEDVLMPFLQRHTTHESAELPRTHLELWAALEHVVDTLRDIEEGRLLGLSVEGLVHSILVVTGAIREHLTMENTKLFPLTLALLTEDEYAELTITMNQALEG